MIRALTLKAPSLLFALSLAGLAVALAGALAAYAG